jgi:hypothetical protein
VIAEPTLEHYVYYLRRVEGDTHKAIQERCAAFEGELRALLAHLECLSGQAILTWEWPQEGEDRRISQFVVRTDWLENPATGRLCFVAACVYGDVYWIQVGYGQRGQAGPESFASLRDNAWQPSIMEHLLGSSVYLCGIVANKRDELAAQALAAYTGDSLGSIVSTCLTDDRARLFGSPQQPYVAALFYPNAECEAWAGEAFLNNIVPRLDLYRHKADRQLAWCEENLPVLSEQEQELRDVSGQLSEASPAAVPASGVELLRQFIQLYQVYDGNVGMLTDRQTTVGISLHNLGVVLGELGPLPKDHLLSAAHDCLWERHEQLEANLERADRTRQQVEETISTLKAELELDHLASLQAEPAETGLIERGRFPGALPPFEAEMHSPQIEINPSQEISLPGPEMNLLQQIYRGYAQVAVKKEFGGGYSGTRVLLTLPARASGRSTALRVAKLGPALELRRERDNYRQYVGDSLPYCAAPVEWDRYYEQDNQAGLSYLFVGGGALGETMDLEEYYIEAVSSRAVDRVVRTLDYLLDKELGQRWYIEYDTLDCPFAAEYGRHLVEHLRLKLRPGFPDALWPVGQPPRPADGYQQIKVDAVPREYAVIQPGTSLLVEGLVVRKIKHSVIKLQDPDGQGIVVRVELEPESDTVQGLKLGDRVGARGEVVYNRRGRMEGLVRAAFPNLVPAVGSEHVTLPGVPGTYLNPLEVYPCVLSKRLKNSRESCVHGDLHLRNVLVDAFGIGRLIDFARVEIRHNLFDFVKLETYVRVAGLAGVDVHFSLNDYVRFEEALAAATLGEDGVACPDNSHLRSAYQVILAIRDIAQKYMGREPDFKCEYFPALFLYCLAVIKYYQKDTPKPTRLAFATACVLGQYVLGDDDHACLSAQPP